MKRIVKRVFPKCLLPYIRFLNNLVIRKDVVCLRSIDFLKDKSNLVVLGNGPSLDKDVDNIRRRKGDVDFFCVNNFSCSEYYEEFKPNKYLFIDDYFFSDDAHIDWVVQRSETFLKINEKTSWKLQIFIPPQADLSFFESQFSNENIEVIKFGASGYVSENLKSSFFHFNSGWFGPFQGNVLIYAIYLGLWSEYKRIEIYGADLSMHENVKVNQKTNELYMTFKHFNNTQKRERFLKNPDKKTPFLMHEFLFLTAETFYAHRVLNEYAASKKIEIFNMSSFSLIDAYKREGVENEFS